MGYMMWQSSRGADGGVEAMQLLGWKPELRIIVLVDEIIIIWDPLLISETLEVAADKH